MTKFNVTLSEIKAALLFASDDDDRYVINTVHFECKPKCKPLLVATNGRTLCVIETQCDQPEGYDDQGAFNLSVHRDFLKPFCAFVKTQVGELEQVEIEYHAPSRIICKTCSPVIVESEGRDVVEGDFPNFRNVIPLGAKTPQPNLGLNPEYVADFGKAGKLLGVETPLLQVNLFDAEKAYEIRIGQAPQFYGLLMPVKHDENVEWQPEFLALKKEVAEVTP